MLNDQPLLHLHTELTSDEVTELERFVTALDDSNLPDGVEWKPKIEALRKALTNLSADTNPVPDSTRRWSVVLRSSRTPTSCSTNRTRACPPGRPSRSSMR